MFIFVLLMLLISLHNLVQGRIFVETTTAHLQASLDALDSGTTRKRDLTSDDAMLVLYVLTVLPMYFILIYQAIPIDVLGYPTKAMLALTVLNFVIGKIVDKRESSADPLVKRAKLYVKIANADKRTFRGTITQFLWVAYTTYLLFILMGGMN